MERGDWDNDANDPNDRHDAPLPAHERTWRHPSEMGAAQWLQSEPPLVVGRGLSVATGTVGAVLALGLLWLMVPHPGRGSDVAVEASTTSVRTSPLAQPPQIARELSATTAPADSATGSGPAAVTVGSDTAVTPVADLVPASASTFGTVSPVSPVPTMLLGRRDDASESMPPVAVALTPGHYVVTTAAAVRGRENFAVQLPSGETVVGAVVSVDVANGTAVLSVATEFDEAMIAASRSEESAGGVTVMTPEATSASLWVDDDGTQVSYDDGGGASATGEGSLVLDGDGRLMGMCTKSASGYQLVTVATLLEALASAPSNRTPAWLGIEAGLDASAHVTVTQVVDGGPAAAAGLQVGDVIVSIDGVPLADLETLRQLVVAHSAGETVTLTIERPSADPTTTTNAGSTSTTLGASTGSGGPSSTAPTTTLAAAGTALGATSSSVTANTTVDVMIALSQQPGSL